VKRPRPRHTTVPAARPPLTPAPRRRPLGTVPPPRRQIRRPPRAPARRRAAELVVSSDTSLVDVIDSLLNKGVVLNADIILALANVDLVYLRLSALLCAADRVFPR
jgi:hypothetical protein